MNWYKKFVEHSFLFTLVKGNKCGQILFRSVSVIATYLVLAKDLKNQVFYRSWGDWGWIKRLLRFWWNLTETFVKGANFWWRHSLGENFECEVIIDQKSAKFLSWSQKGSYDTSYERSSPADFRYVFCFSLWRHHVASETLMCPKNGDSDVLASYVKQ